MTVTSQVKSVTANGNASATTFSFSPIVIFQSSDLVVTHVDENDVETVLSEGASATTYSVEIDVYPATGSIKYPAVGGTPLPATDSLVMKRTLTVEQQTDLQNQGGYNSETMENQLDKLVMIDLQQQEEIDRSLKAPISVSGVDYTLPLPSAGLAIGWNDDADGMTNIASAGTLSVPVVIAEGGTGAATAAAARTNLGLGTAATGDVGTDVQAFAATASQAEAEAGTETALRSWSPERILNAIGSLSGRQGIIGGHVEWSVSGNALTAAIKTSDGGDPSASEPVYVAFRNATAATATLQVRKITAATSVVASSGSTLGVISATAFKIWCVALDNAGTVELALFQSVATASTSPRINGLYNDEIVSSSAEGGAGAADSAGVLYSTTARTSVAMRVLGYAEWNSGLTTAGTWDTAPTKEQLWMAGIALPGDRVQIQESLDSAFATGSTVMVHDDTIPQSTEGDQFMSVAITPKSAAHLHRIRHLGDYDRTSAADLFILAVFKDSDASALAAFTDRITANGVAHIFPIEHVRVAGGTAEITYKLRAGQVNAGKQLLLMV